MTEEKKKGGGIKATGFELEDLLTKRIRHDLQRLPTVQDRLRVLDVVRGQVLAMGNARQSGTEPAQTTIPAAIDPPQSLSNWGT